MNLNKSKDNPGTDNAHKRALFSDKLAKVVVYIGGITTIFSVVAILIFIFWEALPLWFGADANDNTNLNYRNLMQTRQPISAGTDEYKSIIYAITDSGTVDFISVDDLKILSSIPVPLSGDQKIVSASRTLSGNNFAVGTDKGEILTFQINFKFSFSEKKKRIITPELTFNKALQIDSLKRAVSKVVYRLNESGDFSIAALSGENELIIYSSVKDYTSQGKEEEKIYQKNLTDYFKDKITSIELDENLEQLMVGTERGMLYYFSLKDKNKPELINKLNVTPSGHSAITSLGFIIGDQSLIVGDRSGRVTSWMRILDEKSEYGWQLVNSHVFDSHSDAVTEFSASPRNKSFITGDVTGKIFVEHLTSERTLLELSGKNLPLKDIYYTPKSDGAVILYEDGTIILFDIYNPHPEISLKTLFGKVWYEGYAKPEFVWQSTGGTDDFEPKFSLIPLIVGTLKGTVYALLFAIPLALFGALYTSQFAHPVLKNYIKPTIEIMAALPSVVIGFLAGLWLAPLLEKILPGVLLMFIIVPLFIILGNYFWRNIPKLTGFTPRSGYELVLIVPFIVLGGYFALYIAPYFENLVFHGDYRFWLMETLNEQYDQRNAIVVGFAMGFAVIPIIFTICEDSLSSVPTNLTSASLALGASRWQTAVRIILPSASPGIFSAIMIGFGRAIGETMIVLMATGNTPLLDFSPFNGMRTLSANIAVEIPEAPYQGTLYRVLFLTATLLFIMTFIVNTVAEIVRQRLRKKYSEL
ncbi:MAG: ABC transporter permease subunit [Ignavibacteriaceae bacterium]